MSAAAQYAKDQPAGYVNHIKTVAVIGAGGQMGKYIVAELLKNKNITVTAISRVGSKSKLPEGVKVVEVDYSKHETLVAGFKGQDYLVATLPTSGADDLQDRIVDAAVEAGVKVFTPNEWGYDGPSEQFDQLNIVGGKKRVERKYIAKKGLTWIGVSGGFWYEYSLSGGIEFFRIDVKSRTVEFIDEGTVKASVSTWEQDARAVAALAALPILPQDASDKQVTLSKYFNDFVRVQSFLLSQRDILASVQRQTNTTDADWKISSRPHKEIHDDGLRRMQSGDFNGFLAALYTPAFFPSEEANFVKRGVLNNADLGLKDEDVDAATKRAIQMAEDNYVAKQFAGANA